ncbi:MerR HTH family regulatory protein [Roseovarius azorensis]|uniref:MerR HTH family regulatory protein n=1 Tax=Roseovarius azorensis TaxID=1287727 RepID=A0A1H7HRV3_9RHOB|nr:MerR family transcriptional regulator [Roseovarius azorensis]SEK51740.1 MerR HTH family regulatory protein [Roseovarius azorensis]
MAKSVDAFRTISEVAEWLEVPPHVLRFWESKFSQVKPVKRAGGRRYYRPTDMLLLGGIKMLLHDEGMTIKGVQKLLREQGVRHVSEFSQALDDLTGEEESGIALDVTEEAPAAAQVLRFDRVGRAQDRSAAEDAEEVTGEEEAPPPDMPEEVAVPEQVAPEDGAKTPAEGREAAAAPRPLPDLPEDADDDMPAAPAGPLTALAALRQPLAPGDAARLQPFVERLRALAASSAPDARGRE